MQKEIEAGTQEWTGKMIKRERWLSIKGYERKYQISNLGRVKSLSRKMWNGYIFWISGEKILKQSLDRRGYYKILLCKDSKNHKTHRVHRLIAQAFIPNNSNKNFINHINGIKTDNRISNLEWCTHQDNCQHAQDLGLNKARFSEKQKIATKNAAQKRRKLNAEQILTIKKIREEENLGGRKIGKILNIPKHLVDSVIYRNNCRDIL